jgi:antirestriction protein ArdC
MRLLRIESSKHWKRELSLGKKSGKRAPLACLSTGKPYRGINVWMLLCSGYSSNQWLTYKQAQDMGGQVRKGSKASPVVFWSFPKRENKETGEIDGFAFMKQYSVFNLDQIDGLTLPLPLENGIAFDPIEKADAVISAFQASGKAPRFQHDGGDRAFYRPSTDSVSMPVPESFTSNGAYYSTLFHEFAHSTGHASRLDRKDAFNAEGFGSESYSKEELVAEFSAAFLCGETGISNEQLETNQAAYIQGWLRKLANDKTLAVSAAQKAQKAADFILLRAANQSAEVSA